MSFIERRDEVTTMSAFQDPLPPPKFQLGDMVKQMIAGRPAIVIRRRLSAYADEWVYMITGYKYWVSERNLLAISIGYQNAT